MAGDVFALTPCRTACPTHADLAVDMAEASAASGMDPADLWAGQSLLLGRDTVRARLHYLHRCGITRARISRGQLLFIGLAPLGLSLLIAGAFVETFHHIETPLSVAGAILLATAHICRWRFHERRD